MYLDNKAGTLQCHNPGSCKLDNPHNCNQAENHDNLHSHLQKERRIKVSAVDVYGKYKKCWSMQRKDCRRIIQSLSNEKLVFCMCSLGREHIVSFSQFLAFSPLPSQMTLISLDDLTRGRGDGPQYGTHFRAYLSYLANIGKITDKLKNEERLFTKNSVLSWKCL